MQETLLRRQQALEEILFCTERERGALASIEAETRVFEAYVPDQVY